MDEIFSIITSSLNYKTILTLLYDDILFNEFRK